MLSVSLAGTMLEGLTSSGIMQMVSKANREIENWNIEIFGDMEKDADGNLVQKQWTIPRSDSKTIHATENSEVKSAYEKLMNNEQNQKDKARYEELSKKEELDDNETKEFNELCRKLITVRDGKLGEHIGYAPLFRSGEEGDELDLEKGIDYNLADKGLGQMGKIMLDFQWNSMRASQGWAKLSLPMYDQPLWKNNGSWFEPPTLRSVSSVVMEIVGTATGQAWWFSYADDLLFAAMDLGAGYKSASEVGLELAKTAATAAIGAGMGAASNALGDIAGNALQGASKFTNFAAQAGISMTTNYVTSVANSAVNSLYIGQDGKLGFKTEDFTKSLYSANTISGALGAGITGGMGALNLRDGNNIKLNSNTFNVSGISAFNSLAGGLVQNGVALAMGGNANFNLLNYKGVGLLELSFGKDGVKSKIGMGGTNISIQNLRNVAAGYKESSKVTDWKYGSTETSSTLNSINMLGYTTSGMNQQLAKDIWNEKLAVEYGDFEGNALGRADRESNTIYISDKLLGGGKEGSAQIASMFSHEGLHLNGYDELQSRVGGYDTYAQLQKQFGVTGESYDSISDIAYMTEVYKQYGEEGLFFSLFFGSSFDESNQDKYFAEISDPTWRQRESVDLKDVALARGYEEITVESKNLITEALMYEHYKNEEFHIYRKNNPDTKYTKDTFEYKYATKEDFLKSNLAKDYDPIDYDSLYSAGCTLATTAYIAYSLSGNLYSFKEANQLLIQKDMEAEKNKFYSERIFTEDSTNGYQLNLIGIGNQYANAVNALAGYKAIEYQNADKNGLWSSSSYMGENNIASALHFYSSMPFQEYVAHVRIASSTNPKYRNAHSTVFNGINYSSMNFYDATINYVSSIDVLDPISGNKTVPLEDVYRVDIFKVLERRNWNNYSRLFPEYEVR